MHIWLKLVSGKKRIKITRTLVFVNYNQITYRKEKLDPDEDLKKDPMRT